MAEPARGHLRIYLGGAPGVGKTYAMLSEGHRRARRGTDVVIAYVESHGRPSTDALVDGLELVPRRVLEHRGRPFEELDLPAVLARGPEVALVDELAHTNVPGAEHEKRWEDVEAILDAGIDVISTVNVQHLESLNDVVEQITGIAQQETVPDRIVREADQVELIDMTPEALRRRMEHGNIYAPEKVEEALGSYFRPGNLAALRELALLWLADKVDEALVHYQDRHGIDATWETRERVVVALTGAPGGDRLVRRAARIAGRVGGEVLGVHVRRADGLADEVPAGLERQRLLLEQLGGSYHEVVGDEIGLALVQFARSERATQIVLGATRRSRRAELMRGSIVERVIRASGDLDVHVISHHADEGTPPARAPGRRRLRWRGRSPLSRRRRALGWGLVVLLVPLVTAALVAVRESFGLSGALMAYVLVVVAASVVGGTGPGLAAALASALTANWFLTEPYRTFIIDAPEATAALVAYVIIGTVVSLLVSRSERRAAEARRATNEAEALARAAAGLALEADPLPAVLDRVRSAFSLRGAGLYVRSEGSWHLEHASGEIVAPHPGRADLQVASGPDAVLALVGPIPSADERLVLSAFASQLEVALQQRRLRAQASAAEVAAEGDALRTSLLRAVSHDLRTPLASIKASISSLLQDDVGWSSADRREFEETIDEETDRLDRLVGNLLDMGRLETGVLQTRREVVDWHDVVSRALTTLPSFPPEVVLLDLDPDLGPITADPGLLERAVANVVLNALQHRGSEPVTITARRLPLDVELRVIDHGPGIPEKQREHLFQPFQRLGDGGADRSGVGLGLSVAYGFVRSMGGDIRTEGTPGGGLTVCIAIPAARPAEASR